MWLLRAVIIFGKVAESSLPLHKSVYFSGSENVTSVPTLPKVQPHKSSRKSHFGNSRMQDLYHIDVTHCTPPARARLHPAPFVKMPQNLVKFSENLHISYERILSTIKSLEQTYKFAPPPHRKDPIQKSLDIKSKQV